MARRKNHPPRGKADQFATFDQFVARIYLPFARARKRSWCIDERIARKHLSPVFGHRPFALIERRDIEAWLADLAKGGFAPASCNRYLATLKSICALAERDGYAKASPCMGVAFLPPPALRERCLSRQEAAKLMRWLEGSARPEAFALRLLLLTGARKREILHARWENVDFQMRLLTVPLSKSGKARHIVLSDAALRALKDLPRRGDWLFPGKCPGKPLSDIYIFWNLTRQSLGLTNARIHDLRHTFASFLVNSGHSLYETQKMLGHADPRTTMRYAHLGNSSMLAAAETVSNCIRASRPQAIMARRPAARRPRPGSASYADSTK